jgi:exoribonuclease-2
MGTRPAPHAGMGVAQYAWSTSPLRRYVDLVNQWQLIACARHGRTAALAAPFKPKDVQLLAIVSAFDAAYTAYNGFQGGMERYWTLMYLAQNGLAELDATVLKDGLVRADALPLVFRALGAEGLPRGTGVRVRIASTNLLTLDVHAAVSARLEDAKVRGGTGAPPAVDDDEAAEETEAAGPLTLAIDASDEAPADAEGASVAAAAG